MTVNWKAVALFLSDRFSFLHIFSYTDRSLFISTKVYHLFFVIKNGGFYYFFRRTFLIVRLTQLLFFSIFARNFQYTLSGGEFKVFAPFSVRRRKMHFSSTFSSSGAFNSTYTRKNPRRRRRRFYGFFLRLAWLWLRFAVCLLPSFLSFTRSLDKFVRRLTWSEARRR